MDWTEWVAYFAVSCISLLIGYLLGVRQSRAVKKRVMQDYNNQSLELLEANSKLNQLGGYAQTQARRERLLGLTLDKLRKSNQQLRTMELQKEALNRRAFVKMSKLRLRAVQAEEKAGRYRKMARKAHDRLQQLQNLAPVPARQQRRRAGKSAIQNPVRAGSTDQTAIDTNLDAEVRKHARGNSSARISKLRDNTKVTVVS